MSVWCVCSFPRSCQRSREPRGGVHGRGVSGGRRASGGVSAGGCVAGHSEPGHPWTDFPPRSEANPQVMRRHVDVMDAKLISCLC